MHSKLFASRVALALTFASAAAAALANAGCSSCAKDDFGTKESQQQQAPVSTASTPKHIRAPMLQNIMGDGGGADAGVPPPP